MQFIVFTNVITMLEWLHSVAFFVIQYTEVFDFLCDKEERGFVNVVVL